MKNMGMKVTETEWKDMTKSLPVDGECVRSNSPKSTGTQEFLFGLGWFLLW